MKVRYVLMTKSKCYISGIKNLNQVKLITNNGTNMHGVTRDMIRYTENTTSMTFLPKLYNLNVIIRKHWTNLNRGIFYKINGLCVF